MSDNGEVIELAVKPKAAPDTAEQEFGVSSNLPTGSWAEWVSGPTGEKLIQTRSNAALTISQLVDMRRKDGQVRALQRLLTLPILAATREAKWMPPEEGKGQEETEFANLMFSLPPQSGGMTVSQMKFIRQTLLAIIEGFACFEEVRRIPTEGPLKGKIALKKLAHRDAQSIRFLVSEDGSLAGVRQIANVAGRSVDVKIPKDKMWYYAANEEENPYYGVSFFESAYTHYDMKRKLYYISHVAAQFAAVPGRVGESPRTASKKEIQEFQKALEAFAFNTAMSHPEGFKVDFANQNTGFNFITLIDHQNAMMAKSVLAKFMEDAGRTVLVENSSADPSADYFVMQLESIMDEIASSLSTYMIPKYIDWNFGSGMYPKFKFGPLNDASKDVIKELLQSVATVQSSKWTDEFIRETEKTMAARLGLDIDYKEIEKADVEKKKIADAQQQFELAQIQQFMNRPKTPPGGAPPSGGTPAAAPAAAPAQKAALAAASSGMKLTLSDVAREVLRLAESQED